MSYQDNLINNNVNKNEVTFQIIKEIGVISQSTFSSWTREVNLISWNGGAPRFDIRDWAPEHARMSKGITLSRNEAENLCKFLSDELNQFEVEMEDF